MNVKTKAIVVALAAVLLLSLTANGILGVMLAKERENSDRYLYDPEYALGGEDQDAQPAIDETTEPTIQIKTSLITFDLPEALQDKITLRTTENESNMEITAVAKGYNLDVLLFSFVFSKDTPDGYLLGVIQDENKGQWNVAVNVEQIVPEGWSDEEYSQICQLQEYVNEFMIQIQKDARFIPSQAAEQ